MKEGNHDFRTSPEYETSTENETLNSMVVPWQRAKKDITPEEYNNFYKESSSTLKTRLRRSMSALEGAVTYKALLYIPARAPYDFYTKDFKKGLAAVLLRRADHGKLRELLPDCFRFVRGVVDSRDLSLNISREMLQHDRQLKFAAGNLEKKIKAELAKLMEQDREKYEKFYAAFGMQIKYGVLNDYGAKRSFGRSKLLLVDKQNKLVTLKEYDRRHAGGAEVHLLRKRRKPAEPSVSFRSSEMLRQKGYDVLLMTDEVMSLYRSR